MVFLGEKNHFEVINLKLRCCDELKHCQDFVTSVMTGLQCVLIFPGGFFCCRLNVLEMRCSGCGWRTTDNSCRGLGFLYSSGKV